MNTPLNKLFGKSGQIYEPILKSLISEVVGTKYTFLDNEQFEQLSPEKMMHTYWIEILYRAHWGASANLLRHKRWFDACLRLYTPSPNYLGFCASLRALLEGAVDASFSLSAVPLTLAQNFQSIQEALDEKSNKFIISKELEDTLIHFHYARKLDKDEDAPSSHKAEFLTKYISAVEPKNREIIKPLYSSLCQIAHPAAQSLFWMSMTKNESIKLTDDNDKEYIENICDEFSEAIEYIQMQSLNSSMMILKTLNYFSIHGLKTKKMDGIEMSNIPIWNKIVEEIMKKNNKELSNKIASK